MKGKIAVKYLIILIIGVLAAALLITTTSNMVDNIMTNAFETALE